MQFSLTALSFLRIYGLCVCVYVWLLQFLMMTKKDVNTWTRQNVVRMKKDGRKREENFTIHPCESHFAVELAISICYALLSSNRICVFYWIAFFFSSLLFSSLLAVKIDLWLEAAELKYLFTQTHKKYKWF